MSADGGGLAEAHGAPRSRQPRCRRARGSGCPGTSDGHRPPHRGRAPHRGPSPTPSAPPGPCGGTVAAAGHRGPCARAEVRLVPVQRGRGRERGPSWQRGGQGRGVGCWVGTPSPCSLSTSPALLPPRPSPGLFQGPRRRRNGELEAPSEGLARKEEGPPSHPTRSASTPGLQPPPPSAPRAQPQSQPLVRSRSDTHTNEQGNETWEQAPSPQARAAGAPPSRSALYLLRLLTTA